jgi:hypothetical protein
LFNVVTLDPVGANTEDLSPAARSVQLVGGVVTVAVPRVKVTVYVLVAPLCAVTMIVKVFEPVFREIEFDALPEVTVDPFTVTVATLEFVVGVTFTELIAFVTTEV